MFFTNWDIRTLGRQMFVKKVDMYPVLGTVVQVFVFRAASVWDNVCFVIHSTMMNEGKKTTQHSFQTIPQMAEGKNTTQHKKKKTLNILFQPSLKWLTKTSPLTDSFSVCPLSNRMSCYDL